MFNSGILYLVSTPIGNLEDMTFRAVRVLKEADLIAAEDTRRSSILLNHFGIETKMESYHDYNKAKKTPVLIHSLLDGKKIALVSDAGTPGISDPAYNIVEQAIQNNIPVIPIPGPAALVSALIVSGLPTDRFVFEGFLPVKKGRKTRLEKIAQEPRTLILYESPHRLLRTLNDLKNVLGDRSVAICREMTKKFEEIQRGNISEMVEVYGKRKIQGEFVLVVHGQKK